MNYYNLIDRVVIEVQSHDREHVDNEFIAAKLREIADKIEDCQSGGEIVDPSDEETYLLWEHETPRYSGFKIEPKDVSLISRFYFHSV